MNFLNRRDPIRAAKKKNAGINSKKASKNTIKASSAKKGTMKAATNKNKKTLATNPVVRSINTKMS